MRTGFRLGKFHRIIIFIILCLIAITTIYPLLFMAYNTFKTAVEYRIAPLKLPNQVHFSNYIKMVKSYNIIRLLSNTVIIVTSSIALAIFFGSIAAYTFAKTQFKGKNILFFFFISLMIIPLQVLMLPLYMLFARLGLTNTKVAMVIIYFGVMLPFALYFLHVNFRTIPEEIIESAKIDGASHFRIYWSLILPIGRPAIVTLFILDFVWLWNELILALIFLQSDRTKTITAGVATIVGGFGTRDLPLFLTGLFLNALPVFILYAFVARFLMKGIIVGAVKG